MSLYLPPDEYVAKWSIVMDLRAPGTGYDDDDDANYECNDALAPRFPSIEFDPEFSCFYAYAETEDEIKSLSEAITEWLEQRRSG